MLPSGGAGYYSTTPGTPGDYSTPTPVGGCRRACPRPSRLCWGGGAGGRQGPPVRALAPSPRLLLRGAHSPALPRYPPSARRRRALPSSPSSPPTGCQRTCRAPRRRRRQRRESQRRLPPAPRAPCAPVSPPCPRKGECIDCHSDSADSGERGPGLRWGDPGEDRGCCARGSGWRN